MFRRAATMFATGQNGMRFVDENARAVRFGDVNQFLKFTKIAVHRIDAFDDNKLTLSLLALQRRIERTGIVMLEFFAATARERRRHRAD